MIGITEYIANVLLLDAGNKEEYYTGELKAAATQANWPPVVILQLEVVMHEGRYVVDYPDSVRETVEILEYGTETTPPNPVIRNFLASLAKREK